MGQTGSVARVNMGTSREGEQTELIAGVNRYGRSISSSKRQSYNHSKHPVKKAVKAAVAVSTKQPRWYAADDVKTPLSSRKSNHKATKLRKTITPGTVLILLAGAFKGKRVVFLKQLDSGLLMITGPFKINGVPLRRVNQVYVIATSTKVDVSKVDVTGLTDTFFAREKVKKEGDEFFKADEEKSKLPQAKKDMQKKIDTQLMPAVEKVTNLYHYLNAKFTLTKNDKPHEMKF